MSNVGNSPNSDQLAVEPVETFIKDGLLKRFSHVFECRAMYAPSTDKTRNMQKMFNGKTIEYPYAFIQHPTITSDDTSYSSHMTTRVGIPIMVSPTNEQRVRLLPTLFEFEVEYVCSGYEGNKNSVSHFTKRWMFARRMGQLKFNIEYGGLSIRVGCEMSTIQTPPRGNATEEETEYKSTGTITLKGYLSEPLLKSVGVIQDLEVEGYIFSTNGSLQGAQFMSFDKDNQT